MDHSRSRVRDRDTGCEDEVKEGALSADRVLERDADDAAGCEALPLLLPPAALAAVLRSLGSVVLLPPHGTGK